MRRHIISAEGQAILAEAPDDEHLDILALRFFQRVGGQQFFDQLCRRFYELVFQDDLLRPLFRSAGPDVHARRLSRHFCAMYGTPDLSEGWSDAFVEAHTHDVLSHDQRARWLELIARAGADVGAVQPHFDDFMGTLTNASSVAMGISRGAAFARGERFDRAGRPLAGPEAPHD